MRRFIAAAALAFALPLTAHAQRNEAVNRVPIVATSGQVAAPSATKPAPAHVPVPLPTKLALATPAPTPVPSPTEPQDWNQAMQAAVLVVQLALVAVKLGTLASYALAALALCYLLVFLFKTAVKDKIVPDAYVPAVNKALMVVSALIGILGFFVGGGGAQGAIAGIVALLGAAAAGPLHRVIDGIAAAKPK